MRKLFKILLFVAYQALFVAVLLYGLEIALRHLDKPKTVVLPTYYTNLSGDYEPNISVLNEIPSNHPYAFTTNSEGLRGLEDIQKHADKGKTFRILCLGDSFTMGWGVDDEWTYPELLKRDLSKKYPDIRFEVINSGMLFTNILDQYDYYKDKGEKLRPDLIIVQYCYNDVDTDFIRDALTRQAGKLEYGKPYKRSWLDSVVKRIKQTAIYNFSIYVNSRLMASRMRGTKSISVGVSKSTLAKIPKDTINMHLLQPTPEEERFTGSKDWSVLKEERIVNLQRFWDTYFNFLDAFHKEVEGTSSFLFIAMPNSREMDHLWNGQSCYFSERCRAADISYVDFTHFARRATNADIEDLFLRADGHLSREGNALVAKQLAEQLEIRRQDGVLRLECKPSGFGRVCDRVESFSFAPEGDTLRLTPPLAGTSLCESASATSTGMGLGDDDMFFETKAGNGVIDLAFRFKQPYANLDLLAFRRTFHNGDSSVICQVSGDGEHYQTRWEYRSGNDNLWDGKELAKVLELQGDGKAREVFVRLLFHGRSGLVFDKKSTAERYRGLLVKASFTRR